MGSGGEVGQNTMHLRLQFIYSIFDKRKGALAASKENLYFCMPAFEVLKM